MLLTHYTDEGILSKDLAECMNQWHEWNVYINISRITKTFQRVF